MGVVYRAHDTLLRRDVALKVLAGAESDPAASRARLLREARSAAALRHPNAVAVFDVGEIEGTAFIAMEVVHGASLRPYVGDSTLPLETKLRWLITLADVLATAHKSGLVHRDIKPENVMVCADGSIKVLDFGIAKRAGEAGEARPGTEEAPSSFRTAEGRVLGTPHYMAPEQKTGAAVDGRADQYAWGIVACELLCGAHPHKAPRGDLLRGPASSGLPSPVLETIARSLSGRASDRFDSMEEIVARLSPFAARGAEAGSSRPELVRIPDDASAEATQPISSTSSRSEDAPVPSSTAPVPLEETGAGEEASPLLPARAPKEPGAWTRALVPGSLAAAAVVALLIARPLGGHPLSPDASATVSASAPDAEPGRKGPSAIRSPSPEAHASYMRGRYFWNQRTEAGLTKAIGYFNEALKTDPDYAGAYVGIADSYLMLPYMSDVTDAEAEAHVHAALEKALALDPGSSQAHAARAAEHQEYHWNLVEAEKEFRRALSLDPRNHVAHQWYGELLFLMPERGDEAISEMKLALEIDPVSVPLHKNYGMVLLYSRRYAEAKAVLERTIEMDTKQPYVHLYMGMVLVELGHYQAGLEELRLHGREAPIPASLRRAGLLVNELYAAGRGGRPALATRLMREIEATGLPNLHPFVGAFSYALAREPAKMYPLLERAITERARWTLFMNVYPAFDPYRDEPRFVALRRRMSEGTTGNDR